MANNVDPYEMVRYEPSYQDLHYSLMFLFEPTRMKDEIRALIVRKDKKGHSSIDIFLSANKNVSMLECPFCLPSEKGGLELTLTAL